MVVIELVKEGGGRQSCWRTGGRCSSNGQMIRKMKRRRLRKH